MPCSLLLQVLVSVPSLPAELAERFKFTKETTSCNHSLPCMGASLFSYGDKVNLILSPYPVDVPVSGSEDSGAEEARLGCQEH